MIYDEELLAPELIQKVFGKDIQLVLEDNNMIDDLYLTKKNNIDTADPMFFVRTPYDGLDDLKRDIIENYILYITSKEKTEEWEARIYIHFYEKFKDLFLHKQSSMVNSRIQRFRKDFFLHDKHDTLDKVETSATNMDRKALKINNDWKEARQSQANINFLMEFLTSSLFNEVDDYLEEVQEEIASKIYNSDYYFGIYAAKYLINFIAHHYCKKCGIPDVKIYITKDALPLQNTPGIINLSYASVDHIKPKDSDYIAELKQKLIDYKKYIDEHKTFKETPIFW